MSDWLPNPFILLLLQLKEWHLININYCNDVITDNMQLLKTFSFSGQTKCSVMRNLLTHFKVFTGCSCHIRNKITDMSEFICEICIDKIYFQGQQFLNTGPCASRVATIVFFATMYFINDSRFIIFKMTEEGGTQYIVCESRLNNEQNTAFEQKESCSCQQVVC